MEASKTLYRKYRPQTFKEVTGQNHIKITLQNELETGQLGHAFLFCGPRGIGKTSLARLVAKSLNCQNRKEGSSEPCNKCISCKEIIEGRSLSIIEIDAASHTGVDNVRENIIANSKVAPGSGKYKVFIIDEAHMLSTAAFNALLKTLEEPPKNVVFILATTEVHKLPLTIISRCQRFDFRKINTPDLLKRLEYIVKEENREVDKAVLENIALYSQGYLRDAISLLEQILVLDNKRITVEQAELVIPRSDFKTVFNLFECLVKRDTTGGIKIINGLINDGVDLTNFTNEMIEFLRKVLLSKISNTLEEFALDLNQELEEKLISISSNVEINRLVKMINVFLEKKQDLKICEISQFPLELGVVQICQDIYLSAASDDFGSDNEKGTPGAGDNSSNSINIGGSKTSALMSELKNIKDKTKQIIKEKLDRKKEPVNLIIDQSAPAEQGRPVELAEIKKLWPQVLKELEEDNHSLFIVLNTAKINKIENNTLQLAVKYSLHCDKINACRQVLQKICQKLFNVKILIEAVHNPDLTVDYSADTQSNPEKDGLKNLVEAFDGKVVE